MADKRTESFLSVWSACPDPACSLAEGGRIVAANAAWQDQIGRAPADLVGRSVLDLIIPDNHADMAHGIRELDAGRAVSFEARFATVDGLARAMSVRAWQSAEGAILLAVVRDRVTFTSPSVPAPAPAEAPRGEFQELWLQSRNVLENSPTYFVVLDTSGRIVDINQTMLDVVGYTREEVMGREYMPMFVPADEHRLILEAMGEKKRTGKAQIGENHVLTRDGRKFLVEWHSNTVFDAEGKVLCAYAVGFEVGERQRMRRALLRSEQRLALHFQQAPVGMIEWAPNFLVLDWNPAAERIFGYSRDEMLGKTGEILVSEAVRPLIMDFWSKLLQSAGGQYSLNENITKDGRVIVCEWHNAPLVDESGQAIGVASLVSDVTERHRAEAELRARERAQAVTIEQLSAPVIDLWEGVLALPIMGAVDETRAARMTESLLHAIVQSGASFTVVDLTGVTAMDAATASHITSMVRAAGLVGTQCLISGIRPAMARTLVELDASLGVETFGTLRAALRRAIEGSIARRRR
jgi:rsbT co-antagonist protein RsbR